MAEATAHGHGSLHAANDPAPVTHDTHQEHPLRTYFVVWGWLFVLSACSYAVDYIGIQGYPRWALILIFMVLKAGLIVAVFMHMALERLALAYAIIIPPVFILVFVTLMVLESEYTLWTRLTFFGAGP